ncbi:SRPBCC family protein [Flavobacterium microcysteis]|uniref:Polyketide cyclase n=1 Tax=Flavobacterium microcysteis TaxID=2596891 RepID=A0A501Q081_9FLAO|nr:SRPBCC family protein [Flavobacterium microcysteis]TPD65734.1 polyketide cyclase [Flavobacterium microcysteis]
MNNSNQTITVETTVKAPISKAWQGFTEPQHIMNWSFASEDWHTPEAENDLRVGGKFRTKMAAKDGSMAFDFEGEYTDVINLKKIEYVMGDGRRVSISFEDLGDGVKVSETFDPENTHPVEFQKAGWQAIMDNFKKYTETL